MNRNPNFDSIIQFAVLSQYNDYDPSIRYPNCLLCCAVLPLKFYTIIFQLTSITPLFEFTKVCLKNMSAI